MPEKLQAFLKKEGKLLNAYYVYSEGESEPRARMFDWEQYEMGRHKRYAEFLRARHAGPVGVRARHAGPVGVDGEAASCRAGFARGGGVLQQAV